MMTNSTCSALFCNNRKHPKYQYCYDCAKRKGLVGRSNGNSFWVWALIIIVLIVAFG